MRDKRRLSMNEKGGEGNKKKRRKRKHLPEPDYSDCILSLDCHQDPCLCPSVGVCGFFFCLWGCVSSNPEWHFSVSRGRRSPPPPPPVMCSRFQKQALGTPTTIGKALYWSSFKMQHRIKGYMLVHVTHNKVSRIVTSIVVGIDLLSNQICIDKSQRKRKRITAIIRRIRIITYLFERSFSMENFDSSNMQEEISGGLVLGKGWGFLSLNGAIGKINCLTPKTLSVLWPSSGESGIDLPPLPCGSLYMS